VTLSAPGSQINADVTIQGGAYSTTDFSGSDVLVSKASSESYTRRIMLKFDTQNYVPAGATIQSAKLYLVLKNAASGENRPLTAYYVNRSFVTGQTNWLYYRSGQAWSSAGGDLGPSFGTTYVDNSIGSTYTFDLTQMVQRTVNGEFGSRYTRMALVDTGGSSSGSYKEFYSTRAYDSSVWPRLVITYGGSGTTSTSSSTTTSSSTSTSTSTTSTSSSGTGTKLRVMQWNIHKTMGTDGVCNPDRTVSTIAQQNVDVVSMNEVNSYAGTCGWDHDMGADLESRLEQKTGIQWYRQSVYVNGVGNVLLSRIQPASSGETYLDNGRGVAQMTLVVNGRNVNVFSTHVEYFNSDWRPAQIQEAVSWAGNFSDPRIIMGDFNTWPDTSDYYLIATPYQDSWTEAQSSGTASAFNGTGNTNGDSRFDYVFHSRISTVSLSGVTVPDTSSGGVKPSDHDPVIAVFRVNYVGRYRSARGPSWASRRVRLSRARRHFQTSFSAIFRTAGKSRRLRT
jgi:endonuclease/exonuclease/phosphatase family metal-dependent hydrolase